MVTLPTARRLPYFKRAFADFCRQTHRSRELVIVLDQGEPAAEAALRAHVNAAGRNDVRLVASEGKQSLGALRNLSRARAAGEIHCMWDDDDLHHPERVARQLTALDGNGAQATALQDALLYFPQHRTLYWTNWRATEGTVLPGTLMCRAGAAVSYPETGPRAQFGEDTDICVQFLRMNALHAITGQPWLLVYVSHGANSWNEAHHAMLADRLGLSRGLLLRREAQIREGMRPFELGPDRVAVCGANGVAFSIEGK